MSALPPPPPPPRPPYGQQPAYGPQVARIRIPAGELRPRRFWYWLAGVVAALAVAGSIVIFATGGDSDVLEALTGEHTRFLAPGEATVELQAGDEQAIYRQVTRAGGFLDDRAANAIECEVTNPSGEPVPLGSDLGVTTLELGADAYVSTFTFDAATTGSYRVACDPGNLSRETVPLLVGERLEVGEVFGFVGRIFAGIAVLLLGVLIAVGIVVPVAIMRSRHKRRLQAEAAAAGHGVGG